MARVSPREFKLAIKAVSNEQNNLKIECDVIPQKDITRFYQGEIISVVEMHALRSYEATISRAKMLCLEIASGNSKEPEDLKRDIISIFECLDQLERAV